MNAEEKTQFMEMQDDVKDIKKQISAFETNLKKLDDMTSKVYFALVGNELGEDGGLVRRIKLLEERIGRDNIRLKKLEERNIKTAVYFSILIAIGSAVLTVGITYIVNTFKQH